MLSIITLILFSTLALIAYYYEIRAFYCRLVGKKMHDLFPDYYNWEEDDVIVYVDEYDEIRRSKLALLSDEGIIVKRYGDLSEEIEPWRIAENQTAKVRKKEVKYRTFHEEILPSIRDNPKTFLLSDGKTEEVDVVYPTFKEILQ